MLKKTYSTTTAETARCKVIEATLSAENAPGLESFSNSSSSPSSDSESVLVREMRRSCDFLPLPVLCGEVKPSSADSGDDVPPRAEPDAKELAVPALSLSRNEEKDVAR